MPNDAGTPADRTTPNRVAFATWRGLPALSKDDCMAVAALARRGVTAEPAVWDDPAVPWADYSAVVVRSTWDYHHRPAEFLGWIRRLESAGVTLWNPAPVLRWNLDKRYLAELEQRGVAVVPTQILPQGSDRTLGSVLDASDWDEVVVKPAISASAHETWRSSRARTAADSSRFAVLLEGADVLVQPYQPAIERGEWSFCFFGGHYSHAVLKRPRPGDFRVQAELGGSVLAQNPGTLLRREAEEVTRLIPGRWLYARVDACEVGGSLLLMELELIEPTLFFHADAAAPDRFAEALHT
jgi:glutathione synthase/RimK-type ligase-like ATP-grasp enzyme